MIVLEQLKLLVNLARIDGDMASKEREYIITIGKAHGFPESSVETLFYGSHDTIIAKDLSPDQRFNYIFNIVQLMKIDERLYEDEIKFCAGIAARLGYKPEVMVELMLKIKIGEMDQKEKDTLKELTNRYLINS
ncbi:MAG TPA: TerB family tellurite resistance protein [Cyclobacteriaceae bacterium]|nr:TerB family tellurite resistance protein [Cyclobacteriaceae bacterium]HPW63669.1 TerB family tellurite resistance protein [Cyclobacteriaceae bacterium]HRG78485.1 TerB family tellurite resistance protein [Cyclobacteriaceae bacterium]